MRVETPFLLRLSSNSVHFPLLFKGFRTILRGTAAVFLSTFLASTETGVKVNLVRGVRFIHGPVIVGKPTDVFSAVLMKTGVKALNEKEDTSGCLQGKT